MTRRWAALVALLGVLTTLTASAAGGGPAFSEAQRQTILSLGPWPPTPAPDPGNAASGRAAAIAYGQRLFSDPRLSAAGRMSCATCHQPARAFTDGLARAVGRVPLDRHTPSLWNVAHQRWQGWDGAADSLWSQSLRALIATDEMAATAPAVSARVRGDTALRRAHVAAFGALPTAGRGDEALLVQVAKALGAYVATLQSPRTPFDDFRDALAGGDAVAAARYPAAAQRGLQLFVDRGRCVLCHGGPAFSHGEFADIGARHFVRPGVVDPGRHGGLRALQASRYNLLSRWADRLDAMDIAVATRHVQAQPRNFGEFKVPMLRGVADTPPYLHDGQLATLEDVVRHYAELNLDRLHADGEQILVPLRLTPGESADLVAFLRSLSADAARR
ncbi:MAG: cytochrome-c peroxidase [Aquabacterium sp.]